eukprot:TRINITY_DN2019_c0_g1_i2.p1 TRINITY_DN2019_c0_g1~~TRINITY_DN2019_c0_g1_i2.p1  ORF type:complete len:176 (+),score=34.69 TRINITY_DN2019_c0_g1_i2:81-608(+)
MNAEKDRAVIELIEKYQLLPHPEGGYYRETYRSSQEVLIVTQEEDNHHQSVKKRMVSTAIYYLLPQGSVSRLHRIPSDELWHFYSGGPLNIVELTSDGEVKETLLGRRTDDGVAHFQHAVPGGVWFGAYPAEGTSYSFVGCTVSPGFELKDLDMADSTALLDQFPHAKHILQPLL